MVSLDDIVFICWAIFIFYWAINWKNVKPSKEKKWGMAKLRFILLGFIIIAIFISKKFNLFTSCHPGLSDCHYLLFQSGSISPTLQILGSILTIVGVIFAVLARRTLADNWSSTIDLKMDHELITNGIYGYVRHPIYTGMLSMVLGAVLVFQSFTVFLIFLFVSVIFMFRIKSEEILMTKTFPKEYPKYKEKVKALIPFIW